MAAQAVAAGADIVNDVSGGALDPAMLPTVGPRSMTPLGPCQADSAPHQHLRSVGVPLTPQRQEPVFACAHMLLLTPLQVASLGVPYVLMHMRGDPQTMQSAQHTSYGCVWRDVGAELQGAAEAAMRAGIPAWNIITDPGASERVFRFCAPCAVGSDECAGCVANLDPG